MTVESSQKLYKAILEEIQNYILIGDFLYPMERVIRELGYLINDLEQDALPDKSQMTLIKSIKQVLENLTNDPN